MFRLSQFMRELIEPTPVRRAKPPGPVVIWNLIPLSCQVPGISSSSYTTSPP